MRLVRAGDGAVVVSELELATRFGSRLRGLMGRRGLPEGGGLWLEPCDGIHMMFMRFAIDALFVGRRAPQDGPGDPRPGDPRPGDTVELLRVCPGLRPWLSLATCRGAAGVVEVPAGRAARLGLAAGDRLRVEAA